MKKVALGILILLFSSISLLGQTIAVIPKGSSHEFWKSVKRGSEKAGHEFGVTIKFRGPKYDDDTDSQIKLVELFIRQGVDAIVLAPNQKEALKPAVQKAVDKGIEVVIIDSAVAGNYHKSFIATDNYLAGKRAGEELAKLVNKDSKIMLTRYNKGNSSTDLREAGFEAAMKEAGLSIAIDEYGGATVGTTYRSLDNVIANNKDIDAIFAPNESSTVGMLKILEKHNLLGKINVIGFDNSEAIQSAIDAGNLAGTIEQDPELMGYLGVKAAVDVLNGLQVDDRIVVNVKYTTK
jgi:ribose transport system substrate-binding protein